MNICLELEKRLEINKSLMSVLTIIGNKFTKQKLKKITDVLEMERSSNILNWRTYFLWRKAIFYEYI